MREHTVSSMLLLAVCMAAAGVFAHTALASEYVHRPIEKTYFGRVGDETVEIYTLTNVHGAEARIMTYGATIVSLMTPDRAGRFKNIVLGFDTLAPYLAGGPYFG